MELNPHHPTTKAMRNQWHKLLAMVMLKRGEKHIVLTLADLANLAESGSNITVQEIDSKIHVRLVDDEEAVKLAQQHGGVTDANNN